MVQPETLALLGCLNVVYRYLVGSVGHVIGPSQSLSVYAEQHRRIHLCPQWDKDKLKMYMWGHRYVVLDATANARFLCVSIHINCVYSVMTILDYVICSVYKGFCSNVKYYAIK
jgi:hypothetical protein